MTTLDLATLPYATRATLTELARAAHQSLQERASAILIEAVDQSRIIERVGLTPKQAELLTFLTAEIRRTGVPPSFDEMMHAVGLKSKSGVYRLIEALEERGRIRRLRNRARAIEVIL